MRKAYGRHQVLRGLDLELQAGRITGLFGRNGTGKTTAIRAMLGHVLPDAGECLFFGRPYTALEHPSRTVGVTFTTPGFHPARTPLAELQLVAAAAELPPARAREALAGAGLEAVADVRIENFSRGMVQRLALAAALLPQPRVLLLDEPTEGIDPQGVRWLRELLRGHTAAGGTALVSSHVLDEMSRVVDDIVVIEGGVAVLSGPLDSLCPPNPCIHIRTRSAAALDTALRASGASVSRSGEELRVAGVSATRVGELAAEIGLVLEELATETVSRRDRLLELVTAAIDGAPRWA